MYPANPCIGTNPRPPRPIDPEVATGTHQYCLMYLLPDFHNCTVQSVSHVRPTYIMEDRSPHYWTLADSHIQGTLIILLTQYAHLVGTHTRWSISNSLWEVESIFIRNEPRPATSHCDSEPNSIHITTIQSRLIMQIVCKAAVISVQDVEEI